MAVTYGHQILVGTANGLYEFGPRERIHLDQLAGRETTALAADTSAYWAIVDGRQLWRAEAGTWRLIGAVEGPPATCLEVVPGGVLIGTEKAHLLDARTGRFERIASFDQTAGREGWGTPWGEPPAVRSIAVGPERPLPTLYVNVHVGGVARSKDGARAWEPTLDIKVDVHQVLCHPLRAGLVLVAAAVGFGISEDSGTSWTFETAGLHASYLRAVALASDTVVVSASKGPSGKQAAVYRRLLSGSEPFEQCRKGLPEWFASNIDTGCLATSGDAVAVGTDEGEVFLSIDRGESWVRSVGGLPPVRCVWLD